MKVGSEQTADGGDPSGGSPTAAGAASIHRDPGLLARGAESSLRGEIHLAGAADGALALAAVVALVRALEVCW